MAGDSTRALRVVGVHGVGNYFGADLPPERTEEIRAVKAKAWARHLSEGLKVSPEHIDLDFAYYADALAPGTVGHGASETDVLRDPLAQEMLQAWAEDLGLSDEVPTGNLTRPVRAISAWASRRFDLAEGRLRAFITVFFTEVADYLRSVDSPARRAAREEVARRIQRHKPSVVVAHSLGSVVAYEALHHHPELQPELLITLGSPLAMPKVVFERLDPAPVGESADLRGLRLPGRTTWVNVADMGDPVAVPPKLSKFFDGLAGEDDHTVSVSPLFHFHHSKNYLKSPITASYVRRFLPG
jgi:pimeloyl-ACP methyl ester carboxylesterase